MDRNSSLLDAALGLDYRSEQSATAGAQLILIEDCVETSGTFVIHHMVKRLLCSRIHSGSIIFVALSYSFSHYDRILRKLGCNLTAHRDNRRFFFIDMLMMECPGVDKGNAADGRLMELYGKIQSAMEAVSSDHLRNCVIIIDDLSLLEVATNGASNDVLNFLHYCHTLPAELDCRLVVLNHEDIYAELGSPLLLQIEYLTDILIKAEPLATGLAADVHGQLTVINRKGQGLMNGSARNFHFKLKENGIECFFPGT
ncbi:hypothetical protein Droror1_Dr00001544 [Drosera rotundifolia]